MRIGVFASHEGTTLQALLDACIDGTIDGQVAVVIGNNAGSGALRRARAAGVPAVRLSSRTHPDPDELDAAILDALRAPGVELVVLAGYMRKIAPRTLAAFDGRILNTHPALLPAYGGQGMYGMAVHEAVLAAGEATTGATVHVIDEEYDHGPVVAQRTVAVEPDDTPASLAERVQGAERSLLVEVVAGVCAGRVRLPA